MDCDQVFMVLTRGPFPSGDADDQAVEEHLLDCESCRRVALALQPAIELFEEATSLDEKDELPTYWGRLISANPTEYLEDDSSEIELTFQPRRSAATRFGRVPSSNRSRPERGDTRSRWPMAGAFLIGIIFCLTALEWMTGSLDAKAPLQPLPSDNSPVSIRSLPARTASMPSMAGLLVCPREERPVDADKVEPVDDSLPKAKGAATAESQAAACCTECHKAGDPSDLNKAAITQVVMACQGCHHQGH